MYKRQHPSKRGWNDEVDLNDQYDEKRQHPGKRHRNSDSPDDAGPCNFLESFTCNKGNLWLDLVENVSKERVEEKRQHPGKRSALESETEEWENNCVSFAFGEANCKFCSLLFGFLLLTLHLTFSALLFPFKWMSPLALSHPCSTQLNGTGRHSESSALPPEGVNSAHFLMGPDPRMIQLCASDLLFPNDSNRLLNLCLRWCY